MNLLNNRKLLRSIIEQIDIIQSINGGSVQTQVNMKRVYQGFEVTVWAPGLPVEAFNLMLESNRLVLFTTLKSEYEGINQPLFDRSFSLPSYIDLGRIDAFYEDQKLTVFLPFKEMDEKEKKKIDIRHLQKIS